MISNENSDPTEIEKFESNADDWWDKNGALKTLHDINPTRLAFIESYCSLTDKHIIDVGCGGGILTESLAAHSNKVTGVDLAENLLGTAKAHAQQNKLSINYLQTNIEVYAQENPERFDVITCMEMLEHVPEPQSIIQALGQLAKPGAMIFLSTLNRNLKSYLTAIIGAEYLFKILPKKTHDYEKFIRPSELANMLRTCGLELVAMQGLNYQPFTRQANLTDNLDVNYLVCCQKSV